jgi:hypothetical protein
VRANTLEQTFRMCSRRTKHTRSPWNVKSAPDHASNKPDFSTFRLAIIFYLNFVGLGETEWVHLVHRPLIGLMYQPRMIDEYREFGGMRIGRGNQSTRRISAPVPLCPPEIPHDLTWVRTRAAAVRTWRLFFLIRRVGCGTGSTRHVGHWMAYCTCPGWLWWWRIFGGMKIGRGNRSSRRKPESAPLFPPQIPLARPGLEPGSPRWEASD